MYYQQSTHHNFGLSLSAALLYDSPFLNVDRSDLHKRVAVNFPPGYTSKWHWCWEFSSASLNVFVWSKKANFSTFLLFTWCDGKPDLTSTLLLKDEKHFSRDRTPNPFQTFRNKQTPFFPSWSSDTKVTFS